MTKAQIDLSTKITRQEIADLFGVTVNTIRRMCNSERIPDKPIFIKHTAYYDKQKVLDWIATNPPIRKPTEKKDKLKEPFIYKSEQRKIILFCQPSLLNRTNY
jgi:transcriptional regulator with XRE-family HTH domain